jgi:hypothetical protein
MTGSEVAPSRGATAPRVAGITKGRSSNEFQALQLGQRPSQRVDSQPHAEQAYTERDFATGRMFFSGR